MKIDDLNDEMLEEILCRLPCYRTARRCKSVSKRWHSIISDPSFITQAFLKHREIKEEEPSSVFLMYMRMFDWKLLIAMIAPPCFQTMPDLSGASKGGRSSWWPSQVVQNYQDVKWTALTYQDGHGFRVVVAHSEPKIEETFITIDLLIYISETCQWRNIHVRLELKPSELELYNNRDSRRSYFQGLVCEGMVCIHYAAHFGAFNPFDVTDTSHGTLTAIDLPSPAGKVRLLVESDGKLVAFEAVWLEYSPICRNFHCEGNLASSARARNRIWKLDMRLELPQWELLLQYADRIDIKGSMSIDAEYDGYFFGIVGVHPSKEHLVYITNVQTRGSFHGPRYRSNKQSWLILLDTKSKSLEHLTKTIPCHDYPLFLFKPLKLDIPCWPTPIPLPQNRLHDNNNSEGE